MRLISRMADRMLRIVVPTISADAACCQQQFWQQNCFCRNINGISVQYVQNCHTECNCTPTCGACFSQGQC